MSLPEKKEYSQTDEAKKKIEEILQKRSEYSEAIKKCDEILMQLKYGISQYSEGSYSCNGFGIGFDLSDYACRDLCKKELQTACRQIVLKNQSKKEAIDV